MLVLFVSSALGQCSPAHTFSVTSSTTVSHNQIALDDGNPIYCINVTVPNVAIAFNSVPDGELEIYQRIHGREVLFDSFSILERPIRMLDYGADTGLIVVQPIGHSQFSFGLVRYPSSCTSRISSARPHDIFHVDENCSHDGCLAPQSTLCYFNALWGDVQYSISGILNPDLNFLNVISSDGRKTMTGTFETDISISGRNQFVYFVLENNGTAENLRSLLSVRISGQYSADLGGPRGKWVSGGLTLFEAGASPGSLTAPKSGAFFVLSSVVFLCLVLAAGAFVLISPAHAEESSSPAEREGGIARLSGDIGPPPSRRKSIVQDGNPEFLEDH
jgi:hypothetical protein